MDITHESKCFPFLYATMEDIDGGMSEVDEFYMFKIIIMIRAKLSADNVITRELEVQTIT